MRDKAHKYSARTMIAVMLMLIATPFASFASASNTYASFEDYCSFEFNDDQGIAYTPNNIINYNPEYAIVEVDPGMYQLTFDCTGQVSSGDLEVAVEGRSQDGLTTKDPSTVVPVSTTTINMASTSVSVSIDATGAVGKIVRAFINIDAVDMNNNHIVLDGQIAIIPMIDTTNDSTPRISFWYGKVNQHNENGTWMTDSDGVSGGGTSAQWGSEGWADRKVEYCQKFWPNTVTVEMRDFVEFITFYTRGNSAAYDSYKPVYDCIQLEEVTVEDNMTDDNNTGNNGTIGGDNGSIGDDNNTGDNNTGDNGTIGDDNNTGNNGTIGGDNGSIGGENNTGDNNTGDNGTIGNDNNTGDNGTIGGDNGSIGEDNSTDNNTIEEYASVSVMIDGIENSIVYGSVYIDELTTGNEYTLRTWVTDSSGNGVYWSDSYSWQAMSWDQNFMYNIQGLADGFYCMKSELHTTSNGASTFVDEDEHCFVLASYVTGSDGCEIIVPDFIIVPDYIIVPDFIIDEDERVGISPIPTPIPGPGDERVGISPIPTPIPAPSEEEVEVEEPSVIGSLVESIVDAIAEMIADIFSESEKEEDSDAESEEVVNGTPVEE